MLCVPASRPSFFSLLLRRSLSLFLSFALSFPRTPYQRWYFRVLSALYFWGCLFIFGGMIFVAPFSILYRYTYTYVYYVLYIATVNPQTNWFRLYIYRFRDMIEMAKGQLKSFQDNSKLATELYFHFKNVISFNYVHGKTLYRLCELFHIANFIDLIVCSECVCVCVHLHVHKLKYVYHMIQIHTLQRDNTNFITIFLVFWVITTALWLLNIYLFRITKLEKCTFKLLYSPKVSVNPKMGNFLVAVIWARCAWQQLNYDGK